MTLLRTHLRSWTLVWLMCQVLSLSALLPPACCAAHEESGAGTECHGAAASGDAAVCPMHAAGGDVCPMHGSSSADTAHAAHVTPPAGDAICVMRGLCDGPAIALGALLSVPGVLPTLSPATIAFTASTLHVAHSSPVEQLLTHDTPPPRL